MFNKFGFTSLFRLLAETPEGVFEAINRTTLNGAITTASNTIVVVSATGAAAGTLVEVDGEQMQIAQSYTSGTTIPVLRGRDGTATLAHPTGAGVVFFLASDQTPPAPQTTVANAYQRARTIQSYSAAGAITLPTPDSDAVAIINGTNALAMTLAAPTSDLDGCLMIVIGNGKAAHTLSLPAGVGLGAGGSGVDVGTFASGAQQCVVLMAANGVWVPFGSFMGGTSLANVTVTWA